MSDNIESLNKRVDDVEKSINESIKNIEKILEEIHFINHRFNTHVEKSNEIMLTKH